MKTMMLILICALTIPALAQTGEKKDLSMARVMRVSGKLVFIRCEPVNDYDVVMEVEPFNWGGSKDTPEKIADFVVTRSLKKAKGSKKKADIEFDAVVIGSTRKDIAIKFKD